MNINYIDYEERSMKVAEKLLKEEDIEKVTGGSTTISYKNCPRCKGQGKFEVRDNGLSSSGYCQACGFHT